GRGRGVGRGGAEGAVLGLARPRRPVRGGLRAGRARLLQDRPDAVLAGRAGAAQPYQRPLSPLRAAGPGRAAALLLRPRVRIPATAAWLIEPWHTSRQRTMDRVRVYLDREGNTLSVWFDDPRKEHVCEESDDDVILVKDRRGRVIGFERLNCL